MRWLPCVRLLLLAVAVPLASSVPVPMTTLSSAKNVTEPVGTAREVLLEVTLPLPLLLGLTVAVNVTVCGDNSVLTGTGLAEEVSVTVAALVAALALTV